MKRILKRLQLTTLILVLVEVASITAFFLMYFFWDAFRSFVKLEYFVVGVSSFVVIDLGFILFSLLRISAYRQKIDLKAADIIGNDVQEAYSFGEIGLVVCDKNDVVVWMSELFTDRQINIIDVNILNWQPKLRELLDSSDNKTIKIQINDNYYDVKYLQDAGLYIFKDISELETTYNHYRDEAPVIGALVIDNYSDVAGNLDDANDMITLVKNAIFNYAKEYGVLLKRTRSDAYSLFCSNLALQKMKADSFSLLDKVRELSAKEETALTISAGFAYGFPDIVHLNEMASNALDIALARGGDHVVLAKHNSELEFYGGRSEALEKRNKVKVRVMADSLMNLIKNSSNALIMGHTDMDMDSLGSCLGILAMANHLDVQAQIVYDPKLTERKTRSALQTVFSRDEIAKITISPHEAISKVRSNTLVFVLDTHRPLLTMAPKLLEKANKVVIIDHHRRSEDFIESPVFSYIEPSASSASELVTELINFSTYNPKIVVPPTYATIMLSGIFLDTNFYKTKTSGLRTFEASMILKEFGADNTQADDFLKDEYEEYALISKIITTIKTPYYGVSYCVSEPGELVESALLAKVCNQVMQLKGMNACFVIGDIEKGQTKISARSDGTINVQLLLEKIGGGGHFASAAALFKNSSIKKVEQSLVDVLDAHLNDARISDTKKKGE